jgi:hypothetical protein
VDHLHALAKARLMHEPIDLTTAMPFRRDDISGVIPMPRRGDTLLRPPVAGEASIYGDDLWVPDDLERLKYHAYQFWTCAIDLVKVWLYGRHDSPEHVAYVVGYLYRHAIEVQLKAMIADNADFRELSAREQAEILKTHDIGELWRELRPRIGDVCTTDELNISETLLAELSELDRRSDGFRYPFSFEGRAGDRATTLQGFSRASFDNFVYVLEGLMCWLTAIEERRLA